MEAEENADYYDRKTSVIYAYFHLISSILLIGGIQMLFANVSFMDENKGMMFCCILPIMIMGVCYGIQIWYIVVVKKELLEINNGGDPNLGGGMDFDH